MKVIEVNHPLIKHKLGLMREGDISRKRFREIASEVDCLLTYEASKYVDLETKTNNIWNNEIEVEQISSAQISVVGI